ncbi:hypothetical protein AB1N83_007601 [Pleurotus pulmonarius]
MFGRAPLAFAWPFPPSIRFQSLNSPKTVRDSPLDHPLSASPRSSTSRAIDIRIASTSTFLLCLYTLNYLGR